MKIFKKKKLSILVHILLSTLCFGENVVELDLNADTMTSTEGLEANYGDVTLNVLEARRDKEKNKVYIEKPFTARMNNPAGRGYLKADKGEMTLDGENGEFYKATGYLEVGMATNAEYPNDKIYYGGDRIDYKNGNILLTNGWFTTDPKIRKVEDPKKVGYHLISETTLIEPDKQMTLENIDFYKGSKSYLPFEFPWYRVNIRPTSQVPLFPSYSSGDDDYGFSTTWGTLWGEKDDKYKGGFAPKYSDKMGLLVGRLENWYETDNLGTSKWNMTDTIVDKKDSDVDKRFNNEFLHNYSGKYGTFDASVLSGTNNTISGLDSIIDDYHDTGFWNTVGKGKDEVKKTDRTEFITLGSELKGMGERKDITLNAKVKQVTDKDSYDLMLYDDFNSADTTGSFSNESGTVSSNSSLYTNLSLYKDNEDYKIGGYYNYLDELAPGSTNLDRSRDESYGFLANDKRNKLYLSYDKATRDKYRPLTFLEKNSDVDPTTFNKRGQALGDSITATYGDYTIVSIPEYDMYNSENIKFVAGEYAVGNFKSTSGYTNDKREYELSFLQDPTRDTIKNNDRDKEYNRYNNIIYDRTQEQRAWSELSNRNFAFTLGGGNEKSEIRDREGFYDYDYGNIEEGIAYKKYKYESEFVDYKIEKKPFEVGNLGEFGAYVGGRYDKYTDQYVTGVDKTDLADNSNRLDLGFNYGMDLYSSETTKVDNKFEYSYQDYNEENELLYHKENFNKFGDTVNFEVGDIEAKYKVTYDLIDNAATGDKKNQLLNNNLDLKLSKEEKINLNYSSNKRFTDENEMDENKNDLTFDNYGASYTNKKHTFGYTREEVDYDIWKIKNTDDSHEDIYTNTFSYGYTFDNKDKLTLSYITADDQRDNYTLNEKEIDTKKEIYGVKYYDYGVRYDNTYSTSYGKNRYLDDDGNDTLSSDTYTLGYIFVDKSMDPEFLKTYAMKEYDKDESNLTSDDLDRVASLLQTRKQQGKEGLPSFKLNESWKRPAAFSGDYNRKFSINTFAEKSKQRYDETNDFFDSLENVGFTTGYSERRIGVGLGYSREMEDETNWTKEDEQYSLMLNMKIGKPSEGYRITTYAKLEREWYDEESELARTMGIELGKEMGYYEWSIAYLTEYDYGDRENDWKVAIQFALLTFPDMPIFGIGAQKDTGPNSKTSPSSSFLSGLKASDVDLED